MELAHHCGATPVVERALEELRAAGARPRRIVRTGVDSLTASELRVARLAATGRTNPEIAQELYISLKTVEMHISRAYSKLDLSGKAARRGLAQALAQPSIAG
jgi:DNA-binding CsgD family transcriptional regulator